MKLSKKDILLLFVTPLAIGEILLFTTELNFWFIALSITIPSMVLAKIRLDKNSDNQISDITQNDSNTK